MDPKLLLETLDAALLHALKAHDADKAHCFTLARGRLVESFDMEIRTVSYVRAASSVSVEDRVAPATQLSAPVTYSNDSDELLRQLEEMRNKFTSAENPPGCC